MDKALPAASSMNWKKLHTLTALAFVCALTVLFCFFLYQYDNKYTAPGPQGEQGVLVLDELSLETYPLVFLTEGWEYYGGQLLEPQDFTDGPPGTSAGLPAQPEYIFIGQYGGFEAGDMAASPHGSASYRLTIKLPEGPAVYLLELPEIFSAYRAYVGGRLVQTMGDPDPPSYFPETGNRTVRIEAGGQVELLISVSDFSHFYSGLTYPPAFGQPDAVSRLLNTRLILRSLVATFALAIGALALFTGFTSRQNKLAISYGLLCLFFIGYTSYPLLKTLVSGFYPFYTIEQVSFCAVLLTAMLIQRQILDRKQKLDRAFIGFGVFMCAIAAVLPFLLTGGKIWVMILYTGLVTGYEWAVAFYLTAATALAVWRGSAYSRELLYGILVFDTALVMDSLLPMYEPIATGWFPELACFALALCTGYVVAREVAVKYRDSSIMKERMNSLERLSSMQNANYEMLNERIEETVTLRHDMRHHFTMIDAFLQNGEFEKLTEYVGEFRTTFQNEAPIHYSSNPVMNALMRHYSQLAEKQGVELSLMLEVGREIKVSEADLCAILSNLLENGLEACLRQKEGARFISLSVKQKTTMLAINMENSTDGNVAGQGGVFSSSKRSEALKDRKGYGLDSIRAIAARYDGAAEFSCDNAKRVFTSTVMLMLE